MRLLLTLIAATAVLACGDDDGDPYQVVGAACGSDLDCVPGAQCAKGGDFPDGTCTLPCVGHADCPPVSACVDRMGGVCLVSCSSEQYCREKYKCKDVRDRDGVGDSLVCIK